MLRDSTNSARKTSLLITAYGPYLIYIYIAAGSQIPPWSFLPAGGGDEDRVLVHFFDFGNPLICLLRALEVVVQCHII